MRMLEDSDSGHGLYLYEELWFILSSFFCKLSILHSLVTPYWIQSFTGCKASRSIDGMHAENLVVLRVEKQA